MPWIFPDFSETIFVCAPASSSAARGFVISTCSKPSATRIATFFPSSFRAIRFPPVYVAFVRSRVSTVLKLRNATPRRMWPRKGLLMLVHGCGRHFRRREFEFFDLILDLVCERRCTGAVYHPVIERQRE